ncbi:MAG: YraN family protein [Clostridiales bacterium]|nr:YraN family protein [Clostridiales bacterium]
MNNVEKGDMGEKLAAEYLRERGYTIIEQNFSVRSGEIDIIAETENTLVFAEVKLRYSKTYGFPRESVGFQKQSKIRRCAQKYISDNNLHSRNCRFDVIEVLMNSGRAQITHLPDAF